MEECKVSIIVPVYGVEKYLEECVESLIHQTYKNLEIILVDDESPDRCPEICDYYAKRDERILVIHKENGGAANARNVGLDICAGEYVGFVDSDDYVKPTYVSELVQIVEREGADIAVCGYYNLYTNKVDEIEMEKPDTYTEVVFLERFLWDWKCGLIWNKLFRRELISSIRFAEGHVIDDEFFTYQLVMNAKKIYVVNLPLYYYRMRKSGVMNQGKKKQMLLDRMEYMTERYEKVTEKYPELKVKYLENLVDNIIWFKREAGEYDDVAKSVKRMQREYFWTVLKSMIDVKLKYAFVKSCMVLDTCNVDGQEKIEEEKFFE